MSLQPLSNLTVAFQHIVLLCVETVDKDHDVALDQRLGSCLGLHGLEPFALVDLMGARCLFYRSGDRQVFGLAEFIRIEITSAATYGEKIVHQKTFQQITEPGYHNSRVPI